MKEAAETGYPVLLKATGGGGGIGIYICHTPEEVKTNFAASVRQVLNPSSYHVAYNRGTRK